jgi:multisubunit Na+/H+ antiporter MnhB subunit
MIYRLAADAVVIVHMAYVLFVIVGLALTLLGCALRWQWVRDPWFRGIHLAMILVVVAEAWLGIVCPLTTWEHRLRELAGDESYQGAFLANLVHDWLFYDAPTWVFTLIYTLFGLAVLATFFFAPPRWKRPPAS